MDEMAEGFAHMMLMMALWAVCIGAGISLMVGSLGFLWSRRAALRPSPEPEVRDEPETQGTQGGAWEPAWDTASPDGRNRDKLWGVIAWVVSSMFAGGAMFFALVFSGLALFAPYLALVLILVPAAVLVYVAAVVFRRIFGRGAGRDRSIVLAKLLPAVALSLAALGLFAVPSEFIVRAILENRSEQAQAREENARKIKDFPAEVVYLPEEREFLAAMPKDARKDPFFSVNVVSRDSSAETDGPENLTGEVKMIYYATSRFDILGGPDDKRPHDVKDVEIQVYPQNSKAARELNGFCRDSTRTSYTATRAESCEPAFTTESGREVYPVLSTDGTPVGYAAYYFEERDVTVELTITTENGGLEGSAESYREVRNLSFPAVVDSLEPVPKSEVIDSMPRGTYFA